MPFRFALTCAGGESAAEWTELARRAEDLGYDCLLVTDHVAQGLAPLPALAAAAALTSRIGLGTYVLCNDLRNPVLLAQEAATVDLISGGRFELGLGAGWLGDDYRRTGISFDPGPQRLRRLIEAVDVIDQLLVTGTCKHDGEHYVVEEHGFAPRRTDGTRLPLLLGGARKAALTWAARTADTVSVLPRTTADGALDQADATPESLDRKVAWIRDAAGERFAGLRLNHVLWECMVMRDPKPVVEAFAGGMGVSPDQVLDNPCLLIGSVDSVAELLHRRRERWGLSTVTVPAAAVTAFAPVVARLSGQ